jgi:hypothetical protein
MQVPAHARRGPAPSAAPAALAQRHGSADLFRERGTLTVGDVHETVHSVILALCTHVLQSAVEAVRVQVVSPGAVQQCQVDAQALQSALAFPPLLPFFQDLVASCESRCSAANARLLTAAELEAKREGT